MFEKSKKEPRLQDLIGHVFVTAIKMTLKAECVLGLSGVDSGDLMLETLSTIAGMEGFTLTNKDEITAEYMSGILNSYGGNHAKECQPE